MTARTMADDDNATTPPVTVCTNVQGVTLELVTMGPRDRHWKVLYSVAKINNSMMTMKEPIVFIMPLMSVWVPRGRKPIMTMGIREVVDQRFVINFGS